MKTFYNFATFINYYIIYVDWQILLCAVDLDSAIFSITRFGINRLGSVLEYEF